MSEEAHPIEGLTSVGAGSMPSLTQGSLTGRKRDIVNQAAVLFDDVGYSRASMEDLAALVGVAKPTLYHYFSSKDEILYEIHREFITDLITKQEARFGTTGTGADHLLAIMTDVLELMRSHRGHVRVFFEHHRELHEDKKSEVVAQRQRYQRMVEEVIGRGVRDGSFSGAVDTRLATLAVFGMCNWAYQWYDPAGLNTPREIAESFFEILSNGL